ncbi:phosphate signaling complex protein PhoU [Streptococcus sp. E29BA]|uniref:phosphate signaling complex protein PhoU n=1 Tax=Streptococcus sp. E29BA TaxID=3278716 RepID=UPI00359E515C
MRQAFQEELDHLQHQVNQLFDLTEQSFVKVHQVLATDDIALAEQILAEDAEINQTQLAIEVAAAHLIARQQPVAKDLRQIVSWMQISSDLEKIGDYSALMAKCLLNLQGHARSTDLEGALLDLGQQAHHLCRLVRSLVNHQKEQELQVVTQLEEALVEKRKSLSATVRRRMDRETDLVLSGTYYLSIALHMERMADYLTNICERLVYIETGRLQEKA